MNKARIFIVGDSTAQYNDANTYPQTGWGQTLGLFLKKGSVVLNFARNGQSSKSFLEAGLFKPAARRLAKGDILLIQFGHNDQKNDSERKTEPFSTYQQYLMQYVDTARAKGAFPVLLTSITRRQFGPNGHLIPKTHFAFPEAMRHLAQEKSIPLIDLYDLSWSLIDAMGDLESKHMFMHLEPGKYSNYPNGLTDNTHFVYAGAFAMAQLVAEGLKRLGSPYSDHVL